MTDLIIIFASKLITELLFIYFLKAFDTPLTKHFVNLAISRLLGLIAAYVKKKLQEHK